MHYEDFCELAALYALDALPQSERDLVQEAIAQFPEWEAELTAMQATVANLAYGIPATPLADGLKQRLFQQIAEESNSSQQDTYDVAALIQQAAEVSWKPHPIPGVTVSQLYSDPVKQEVAYFLRCAAGVELPKHKHFGQEEIVVLAGDVIIDNKTYTVGEYIYCPPGTVHQPKTQNGCLVFVHTFLDIEIVK